MVVNITFLVKNRFWLLFPCRQVLSPHLQAIPTLHASKETTGQKDLSCHCYRDLIVCVQVLSARMTAGLSHGIPVRGSGICPAPVSGPVMHTADSTYFPSGGGARTVMRFVDDRR